VRITEIRVRLLESQNERLRAFCTITFDNMFVVRDVKIIEGSNGTFVAMPSRKLTDHCPKCRTKNHLRAKYCNECGATLPERERASDEGAGNRLYVDIAHPITAECRALIHRAATEEYQRENDRSKQPGYVPRDLIGPDSRPPAPPERPKPDKPAEGEEREFGAGIFD